MPSSTGLKTPKLHTDGLTRTQAEVVRYGAQSEIAEGWGAIVPSATGLKTPKLHKAREIAAAAEPLADFLFDREDGCGVCGEPRVQLVGLLLERNRHPQARDR